MYRRATLLGALRRWSWSLAVLLATVAQLVVAAAPLIEAHAGRSAAAHAESGGTRTHYAHDEATCTACQARSIHGIVAHETPEPPHSDRVVQAPVDVFVGPASAVFHSQANPRAPPVISTVSPVMPH